MCACTGNTYFPLVQSLLAAKLGVPTNVQSYTKSGATLQDLNADLRAPSGKGAPPQSALRSSGQSWDVLVLQEQSAVPMWYNAAKDGGSYDATRYQNDVQFTTVSAKSMASIIDTVQPEPPQIILHETWAYWNGTVDLPATYEGMQARVSAGYAAYKQLMAKRGTPVTVAPCGTAFALVNNDTQAGNAVVPFKELYYGVDSSNPDQKHPSKKGHYLAALTLANTITQSCLQGTAFYVPASQLYDDSNPALGSLSFPTTQQDYLQTVACNATRNQLAASIG